MMLRRHLGFAALLLACSSCESKSDTAAPDAANVVGAADSQSDDDSLADSLRAQITSVHWFRETITAALGGDREYWMTLSPDDSAVELVFRWWAWEGEGDMVPVDTRETGVYELDSAGAIRIETTRDGQTRIEWFQPAVVTAAPRHEYHDGSLAILARDAGLTRRAYRLTDSATWELESGKEDAETTERTHTRIELDFDASECAMTIQISLSMQKVGGDKWEADETFSNILCRFDTMPGWRAAIADTLLKSDGRADLLESTGAAQRVPNELYYPMLEALEPVLFRSGDGPPLVVPSATHWSEEAWWRPGLSPP